MSSTLTSGSHRAWCGSFARNDRNRAFDHRERGNVQIGYFEQDGYDGVMTHFCGLQIVKSTGTGTQWRNHGCGWSRLERSGDAVFAFAPGSQLELRKDYRYRFLSLHLPGDAIESKLFVDRGRLYAALAQFAEQPLLDEALMPLVDSIWTAADEDSGHLGDLFCESAAIALLVQLALQSGVNALPRPTRKGGLTPRTLRSVLELIDNSLDDDINLQVLAARAGLSEFYFIRAFKQATGSTPYQYLLRKRIEAARSALEQRGKRSLAEIASMTGFGSEASLTRQFVRHVGVTPHRYRTLQAA